MDDAAPNLKPRRSLHPAVQGDDPEGRERRAPCNEDRRQRVHPIGHAAETEQHDAEENRLEEESGEHFIGEQGAGDIADAFHIRSEEHTSELQSLMRISYAVFCLKKKTKTIEI